ncbi:hypothetical protein IM40_11470 (plasmid) [Candidatus Paracaedimonas acanthamoebae]|nr:hypothetical protein IM40_11470 [Candidatus Paracaedimonas acanthamoebae]
MKQQFNKNSWDLEHHNRKLKRFEVSDRKAENRTKIQLGGLILKSGLAEFLEINPGDDLQLDPIAREKATILLGVLLYATEHLQNDPDNTLKQECEYRGKKVMIQQFMKSKDHTSPLKSNPY